ALPNLARRLVGAGADGLGLFNRYLQPDVDLEGLRVTPHLALTTPDELRLPLRWIAILRPQLSAPLAGTCGVPTREADVTLTLAGADGVVTASALLGHGTEHLPVLLDGLRTWLEDRSYDSLSSIKGALGGHGGPDRFAFERANYVLAITTFSEFFFEATEVVVQDQ